MRRQNETHPHDPLVFPCWSIDFFPLDPITCAVGHQGSQALKRLVAYFRGIWDLGFISEASLLASAGRRRGSRTWTIRRECPWLWEEREYVLFACGTLCLSDNESLSCPLHVNPQSSIKKRNGAIWHVTPASPLGRRGGSFICMLGVFLIRLTNGRHLKEGPNCFGRRVSASTVSAPSKNRRLRSETTRNRLDSGGQTRAGGDPLPHL